MHWKEAGSPGLGTTEAPLSLEPLATEGEATPGPDDENPFEERDYREDLKAELRDELLREMNEDVSSTPVERDIDRPRIFESAPSLEPPTGPGFDFPEPEATFEADFDVGVDSPGWF